MLAVVARVNVDDNHIIDVSTTLGTTVADNYIKTILIGRDLVKDVEQISRSIQASYFGNAQKAILASFRDMVKRYQEVLSA